MQFSKSGPPKKDDRLGNYMWELEHRPQSKILPSDVLKFSDPLRAVLNQAARIGRISLSEVSKLLDLPPEQAQRVIDLIVEKDFLRRPSSLGDNPVYETRLAVRTRKLNDELPKEILNKLDDL
ncbi:MAG: hypothetical protein QGD88_10040 [Anaerolineae bacterium]|nr:hypothetical protein [Anaerolineae bacterium]MDK1081804.1 hypothetical protein [Anaerolineae bacterium]